MDQCVYCEAETELHNCGVPVCVKCSNGRPDKQKQDTSERDVLNILQREYQEATEQGSAAIQAFDAAIDRKGPSPDGTQRINDASNRVSVARESLMNAYKRLEDFMKRGIVPEDLKGSG